MTIIEDVNPIDEYIRQFPEEVQVLLQEIRQLIKETAPEAEEKISYQMPTFFLDGNLVHFAAYKNHIGFYPAPSGIEKFKQELSKYKSAKGSVQFPLNQPIPFDLIRKIVAFRVAENQTTAKNKQKKSKIKDKSPEDYIRRQPEDRQEHLEKLRQTIKAHLPEGFQEMMQYNMISFVVPHSHYPKGYHVNPREPLPFMALANQKGHIALYHLGIYADESLLRWFSGAYEALEIGKLDIGKSCIRFRKMNKIPYDLIGELCTKMTVDDYIKLYESV